MLTSAVLLRAVPTCAGVCCAACCPACRPRIDVLEPFWEEKRKAALRRAGLPEDSPTCPDKNSSAPATNGLVIGVSVAAAALFLALCGTLLWAHKKGHCRGLQLQLSRMLSGGSNKDRDSPADLEAPVTPSPKAAFDADRSQHSPDQHKRQEQQVQLLKDAATSAVPLDGSDVYVNAGASSSAASSSMVSSLYSSGPFVGNGALTEQQTPATLLPSATMERSPFAAMFSGKDGLPAFEPSRAVGMHPHMPQPPSASASGGTTSSSSSRGTAAGSNSSSSRQPQQQQHSRNNSHSSHPSRSGYSIVPEGSAGGEGRDLLSPLPDVTTFTLATTPTE